MTNFVVQDYYVDTHTGLRKSIMLNLLENIDDDPEDMIIEVWQDLIIKMPGNPCIAMEGDLVSAMDYVIGGKDDVFAVKFFNRTVPFYEGITDSWNYAKRDRSFVVLCQFAQMRVKYVDGSETDAAAAVATSKRW